MNLRNTPVATTTKFSGPTGRLRSALLLLLVSAAAILFGACPPKQDTKISVILPLTGEYSQYGEAVRRGAVVAEEEVIAADPELGLEIAYLDSASDPVKGKALLDEAYKSSIAAIGGVTSAEALEYIKSAEDSGRALISPTASSPTLSGASRNFFRIFPSADVESAILAGYVTNQLGSERLAVLYQDDAYGKSTTESLKKVFTGEVVAEVAFEIGGDLQGAVDQIVAADPQAVYVAAIGEDLARAIRGLRDSGVVDNDQKKQWILTSSALVSPQILTSAGSAANRVFLAQTDFDVESTEEPIASFVTAYEAKFGEKPGYYEAHGYDAMKVAVEALKESDSGLPDDFIKALRSVNNFPGATGSIQFRESGDVQKFTKGYWVVDGNPVDYEKYITERVQSIRDEQDRIRQEMAANARKLQNSGS